MITVTLGTIPYPFDRSIVWLKSLLDSSVINEPVFLQHGNSNIDLLEDHPLVTSMSVIHQDELQSIIDQSRLVISHAGQGSTRMLAARRVRFVLLPRLAEFHEHVDDHQLMFARSVRSRGVNYCTTLEELEAAVNNPPPPCEAELFAGPSLANHLLQKYPATEQSLVLAHSM